MNRSESRYFATATRMGEAFLTLLAKKDFEYITVKEICEAAGVNRSTFYLHYETLSNSVHCFALWHFYTLLNHTCNICNGIGAVVLEPF